MIQEIQGVIKVIVAYTISELKKNPLLSIRKRFEIKGKKITVPSKVFIKTHFLNHINT